MAQEVIINVKANTKQAEQSLQGVNSEIKETQQVSGELTGSLDKMTGGAITKFTAFKGTLKGVTGGFKSLRVAILSTGIGALIVAVGALTAAFTGSEEGQNKFAKIMTVIGALTGNLVDLLADLGEKIIEVFENPKQAITDFANLIKENITNRFEGMLELIPQLGKAVKLLFSGEFAEAGEVAANAAAKVVLGVEDITDKIESATQATKDFVKEQINEANAAASVADMRAKADKIERKLIVDRSKLESEIALLRLKSRQEEEFSAQERKQALLDAQELEEQLLAQETEFLELRRDAQVLENTFSRSNKENLDKEAQAIADVNRVVARRADAARATQRELNRVSKEIQRDEAAARKEEELAQAEATKKEEARLAAIDKIKNDYLIKEQDRDAQTALQKVQLEESRKLAELDRLNATEQEKQSIRDYYSEQKLEAERQDAEASKKIDDAEAEAKKQNLAKVGGLLMNFASLAGEQTSAGKAAAIAGTLISTYQSATDSYKSLAGIPIVGPALGAAAAAVAVASGFKQIQAIKSVKVPKGRGGEGAATPSASGFTAAATQAPQFNVIGGGATNQLAGLLAEDSQKPVRAYVVSNEVSTAQSLDRNIVESATLG
jgi:hypothetical protein